jgi:hypothetical protein
MALPVMSTPTYSLVVPSTNTTIKYRPFLVKEEKALLIAQQSEDVSVMVDSLKRVIVDCIVDKIDADKLATFDLEYIFTQIRAKSVGETVELYFPCDNDHGADNQKAKTRIILDLTSITVDKPVDHNPKIDLFAEVGVMMKYPSIDVIKKLEGLNSEDINVIFDVIADSIDFIYEGDTIHYAKEQKKDDLVQFLGNLTSEQFLKIQKFFQTMPRLKKDIQYTCPLCQKEHFKVLEGLQSFF